MLIEPDEGGAVALSNGAQVTMPPAGALRQDHRHAEDEYGCPGGAYSSAVLLARHTSCDWMKAN